MYMNINIQRENLERLTCSNNLSRQLLSMCRSSRVAPTKKMPGKGCSVSEHAVGSDEAEGGAEGSAEGAAEEEEEEEEEEEAKEEEAEAKEGEDTMT